MKNLDNNQTLRELIRARKQARPNKQNLDSGNTNSYENTAKFGNENLANSNTATANLNNQNLDENLTNQQKIEAKMQKYHEDLENNKNSRDYDKDPIVIKDYKPQVHLIGIFLMILAFIMLCIARPEKVNAFTIMSLMPAIPYIIRFLGQNYFILNDTMISQIRNSKSFGFIQFKDIKNVKFSVDFRDGNEQIPLVAKILLLIIVSTYIYAIFAFNEPIILFVIFAIIVVFFGLPKIIIHAINGGKFSDSI